MKAQMSPENLPSIGKLLRHILSATIEGLHRLRRKLIAYVTKSITCASCSTGTSNATKGITDDVGINRSGGTVHDHFAAGGTDQHLGTIMLAKTSDDYAPCVVLYPSGKLRKANCLKERIDTVESAIAKLGKDYAAWVRYDDISAVENATGKRWQ